MFVELETKTGKCWINLVQVVRVDEKEPYPKVHLANGDICYVKNEEALWEGMRKYDRKWLKS